MKKIDSMKWIQRITGISFIIASIYLAIPGFYVFIEITSTTDSAGVTREFLFYSASLWIFAASVLTVILIPSVDKWKLPQIWLFNLFFIQMSMFGFLGFELKYRVFLISFVVVMSFIVMNDRKGKEKKSSSCITT